MSAFAAAAIAGSCQTVPAPPPGTDAGTRAWWAITGELSSDAMEGRDTGSAGYERAAKVVEARFRAAGLKAAGENGGFRQTLPLKEVRVEKEGTSFGVYGAGKSADNAVRPLVFLHDITVRATDELPPRLDAELSFRGYCSAAEMGADMAGKIAVCFGARRRGMTSAGDRMKAAADAGAAGLINVDDPGFTIEPSRWPEAYARTVTFKDAAPPAYPKLAVMRLSAEKLATLVGADRAAGILADGAASRPLKSFDFPVRMQATFKLSKREMTSDNVLGLLPGTDPKLKDEVVVVSAHLDGYGFGEPVNGDGLYNGAFDDAAYVATLIRLAEQRQGKGFRRSVLFAAYTGEEKGLLGSNWFSTHLTVPKENLAAVINLDQLRPLFPLSILTMHAVNDTTLGDTVRSVAKPMGIEIREDREPERNLNQRTDHFPFLRIGVPATNFVFGFDPATDAERRYREWYQVRYHRPQDDMGQPIDFKAAADFNTFFDRLTEAVANADQRPAFLPSSPFKPK
ncbi:MAG TPA: M28 family peptidase [Hyphomonadaceae bacterium]|nr:M28 family peptidase [Hyphomonadaceae bacterium]